jgi:hypothetical protein
MKRCQEPIQTQYRHMKDLISMCQLSTDGAVRYGNHFRSLIERYLLSFENVRNEIH